MVCAGRLDPVETDVNYEEFYRAVSEKRQRPLALVKEILDDAAEVLGAELAAGGEVSYRGLGKFKTTERAARQATNPQTQAKENVPAKRVAKFKVGAELERVVESRKPRALP